MLQPFLIAFNVDLVARIHLGPRHLKFSKLKLQFLGTMGISTEEWRISIGSFTKSSHRSKPKRLQQNPSTGDYQHIMKPVARTLLALLIVLSLMSAFAGINIISEGFNPILSIPFESMKTLYKPSILTDMDVQSEPGLDQVKVSQLRLTTRNL